MGFPDQLNILVCCDRNWNNVDARDVIVFVTSLLRESLSVESAEIRRSSIWKDHHVSQVTTALLISMAQDRIPGLQLPSLVFTVFDTVHRITYILTRNVSSDQ
jgi:hypothetical protein